MKTFKASDLSHKRAEVMKAARDGGAIIQEKRTNGDVIEEYVICLKSELDEVGAWAKRLESNILELAEGLGLNPEEIKLREKSN